jgi:glycosyltransferase involved in cell wall biosynthesis
LAKQHPVTLASARSGHLENEGIRFISGARERPELLKAAAANADIVIVQGLTLFLFPFLMRARHLVVEVYDPYLFEYLEYGHARFPGWGYRRQWYLLNQQLLRGDFFICANERQWDYWLGRLCALGRLNPDQYRQDPTFRNLLAVIPFGVPPSPPSHTGRAAKGVIPGISENDILLLWGGGIWQWFDPLTLIRAMALVARERSDVKLLFLGTGHPYPGSPPMPIEAECHELAKNLGVFDRNVFFSREWIPQAQVPNFLLEADIGVSSYWDRVETHFAFRTRVRDCIWAGLPMILTKGDSFAEMVEYRRLGRTVAAGDVEEWKRAILDLAANSRERTEIRARLEDLAKQYHWEKVAEPLVRYCEQPYRTARMPGWSKFAIPLLSSGYQWVYRRSRKLQELRQPGTDVPSGAAKG